MAIILFLFLLLQSVTINGITPDTTNCDNYAECIEHTINSVRINCAADLSCEGSTITSIPSTTSSGYIKCTGDGSCKRSALTSSTNINCNGHASCYYPDYLSATEEIKCDGSYSCYSNPYVGTDPHIHSITSNVLCQGSGSCLASSIESNEDTYCYADQSCSNTNIQSGNDIHCAGNLACKEAILSARNSIYCTGTQSCSQSTSMDGNIMYLYGYSAAFQSTIYASTIKALGYYAMAYAVIDSSSTDVMNIISYGHYSGYGASIICRSGSSCALQCRNTGCTSLDFICLQGSICTVEPNECTESIDDTNIDGTDCPKWTVSVSTDNDEAYLDGIVNKVTDDGIIDAHMHNMESITDAIIDISADTHMVRCGGYQECDSNTFIRDGYTVYCSGKQSCHNAIVDNFEGNTQSSINCMGESACVEATLTGAGVIRCGAEYACNRAQSITGYDDASIVECSGARSCQGIDSISGNAIKCHGALSCRGSVIKGIDYVQCNGFKGCLEGTIASDEGSIECGGFLACAETTLQLQSDVIMCDGFKGCSQAVINGASMVYASGAQSVMASTIYADEVQGFGYKALELAMIDSMNRDMITVNVYGYMAGNKATVICRRGSTCELHCESRGCFNMEFVCLHGSSCSVTPNQCMDHVRTRFQGIDCPRWKISSSEVNDKELIEYLENKVKYHDVLTNKKQINMNSDKELMVMENEIVPRVYHNLYLYLSIAAIIILICIIPVSCYVLNILMNSDDSKIPLLFKMMI